MELEKHVDLHSVHRVTVEPKAQIILEDDRGRTETTPTGSGTRTKNEGGPETIGDRRKGCPPPHPKTPAQVRGQNTGGSVPSYQKKADAA